MEVNAIAIITTSDRVLPLGHPSAVEVAAFTQPFAPKLLKLSTHINMFSCSMLLENAFIGLVFISF